MKIEISSIAIITSVLLASSAPLLAQEEVGTFTVGITVEHECEVSIGDNMSFGAVGGIIEDEISNTSTTTIDVQCSDQTPFQIGLNSGQNPDQVAGSARAMSDGAGNFVGYDLYQDSEGGTSWGDDAPNDTNGGTSSGTLTVYGKVAASQNVPAGLYSDTVTATIWYGDAIPSGV